MLNFANIEALRFIKVKGVDPPDIMTVDMEATRNLKKIQNGF